MPSHALAQSAQSQTTPPQSPGSATSVEHSTASTPPTQLTGALDLAEGYTTNANGQKNSADGFTQGSLDLGLHYAEERLTADAHYILTGYYYDRFHGLNQLQNRLNLTTAAEFIPGQFFIRGSGFAEPAALSRIGAISASEASIYSNNYRNIYGYSVEPQYVLRFDDYMTSQTSLSESGVFFTSPTTSNAGPALPIMPPENAAYTTATQQFLSGSYFSQFKWTLTGSYTDMRMTSQSQDQTEGTADLAYAVNRVISVLATGGYDEYKSTVPLAKNLSGPIALGGVNLSYGQTFQLIAQGGEKHNFPVYMGSLNWDVGTRFNINGSLSDAVTTPQGIILNNLSTLAPVPGSGFSDLQSNYSQTQEQALFPQSATTPLVSENGLALDNSVYRDRLAQLVFQYEDERDHYGLAFFDERRDRLNVINGDTFLGGEDFNTRVVNFLADEFKTSAVPPKSWLYGTSLYMTRNLTRDLTGNAAIGYSFANEFGGNDRILTANAGLSYLLTEDLDCYFQGRYLRRESKAQTFSSLPLSEEFAIIGIRRVF